MVRGIRGRVAVAVAVMAMLGPLVRPSIASAHPLHTSLADVSYDSKSATVLVSLRVFVDDFTTAAARRRQQLVSRGGSSNRSPLVDYALESFGITDSAGRRVVLLSCGGKRVGDLMWLCFKGSIPRGAGKLEVASHVLFDLYRDQINIVKAVADGKSSNLLFTPGDGAKRFP